MSRHWTLYDILDIPASASTDEINRKCMSLLARLHPDRNGGVRLGGLYDFVVHAQSILTNKDSREAYDARLAAAEPPSHHSGPKPSSHPQRERSGRTGSRGTGASSFAFLERLGKKVVESITPDIAEVATEQASNIGAKVVGSAARRVIEKARAWSEVGKAPH